jgi:hypothetical protein
VKRGVFWSTFSNAYRDGTKLCPQAKVIKGDMERYSHCHIPLTEVIQKKSPITEKRVSTNFI